VLHGLRGGAADGIHLPLLAAHILDLLADHPIGGGRHAAAGSRGLVAWGGNGYESQALQRFRGCPQSWGSDAVVVGKQDERSFAFRHRGE
jgi:hypothetical protein